MEVNKGDLIHKCDGRVFLILEWTEELKETFIDMWSDKNLSENDLEPYPFIEICLNEENRLLSEDKVYHRNFTESEIEHMEDMQGDPRPINMGKCKLLKILLNLEI